MPVVADSGVTPERITTCKSTLVKAWAEATGTDRRLAVATRLARTTAIRLRNAQRRIAKAMPCPDRGGCPVACRRRGAEFSSTAFNLTVVRPAAPGGVFKVTVTTHWTYRVRCICPS